MPDIPKRIFYVWGAGEKKKRDVELCIFSWKQHLPDYEIIEINEDSTLYFDFQKELERNLWFKTIYENKMYAYIADYIRIKVLYEHGGIYFDTDVSVLKSMDEYLGNEAFVAIQSDSSMGKSNLEPAILGAVKGNKILGQIIDFYNRDIWEKPIYTMPQIFDYVLEKLYGEIFFPPKNEQTIIRLGAITLYPERYFIPIRAGQAYSDDCIEPETTTIHWFSGSWVKGNIKYFMDNKHKQKLADLIKKCFRTKVIINNPFIKIKKEYKKIYFEADFYYFFRFKHKYYNKTRNLSIFILGKQIKLWKM